MSRDRGQAAEQYALNYLLRQGLSLEALNFRSRFGEIDLIVWDHNCLVFVEVKFRQMGLESAKYAITPRKQQKLLQTARYFMLKRGAECQCRFDAIVLAGDGDCEWIQNIIQF